MASKEDLQDSWQERIKRAEEVRSDWAKLFRVDLARQYFHGQQNLEGWPDDEWITINKLYSHIMAQLPQLYSVDPYFYVKGKKSHSIIGENGQIDEGRLEAFERRGAIRQDMLNYLKVELDLKIKARVAIQQAHFSYGVMKTRHAADEVQNQKAGQPVLDDKGEPILDEQGEELTHPETIPVNKRYALDWINSEDILFDEDAGPLPDSWSWIAQKIRTPKRKALKNRRYKTSVIQAIKGRKAEKKSQGFIKELAARIESAVRGDKDDRENVEIITFWEIYDIDNKEWLTMAEDATELVVDPAPLPKGVEGHPFSFLRFTLLDDSPYPYPPMSPGIDPQKEYNLTRSRMLRHRKRFNRKYTVLEQALSDETELSKLESGDDGTMIRVQTHSAVEPIKDAPLDQQTTFAELAAFDREIVELLGSPGAARGIANADSATEAGILDARLEVKEGDRIAAVTDFVLQTAQNLDFLVQAHISRDEAVKITGPQGEAWRVVRQEAYENIEGEYEYSVNIGASRPRLPDIERAQWIAFLSQVVIPLPNILTRPNVMKRMAEMFHIEDEAALKEFQEMGQAILSGQEQGPGNTGGSQPAEGNPVTAVLGAALGQQGGNAGGGGSQIQ